MGTVVDGILSGNSVSEVVSDLVVLDENECGATITVGVEIEVEVKREEVVNVEVLGNEDVEAGTEEKWTG